MYVTNPHENKRVGYNGTTKLSLTQVRSECKFQSVTLPTVDRKICTRGADSALVLPPKPITTPRRGTFGPVVGRQPLPKVFAFTTWWTEKGKRQHMTMDYFPETKCWRVQVDVPLAIKIYHRNGELLEPYDLHVGARVECLGRIVTLQQASLDVLNWLDDQADILMRRKIQLEAELSKFAHVRHTTLQHFSAKLGKYPANPVRPNGGRINLRGLLDEVRFLDQCLYRYRTPGDNAPVDDESERGVEITTDLPQSEASGALATGQLGAGVEHSEPEVEQQPEAGIEQPESEAEQPQVESSDVAAEGSSTAQ